VTAEQWDEAARVNATSPEQVLLDRRWLSVLQLARARAARVGLEFRTITDRPDPALGEVLPPDLRASGLCAVLDVTADRVVVAVADPAPDLRDALHAAVRPRRLELVVTTPDMLPSPTELDETDTDVAAAAAGNLQLLADQTAAPVIVRLLRDIIEGGIAAASSDIHIADYKQEEGCRAYYRVDGKGRPGPTFPRRHLVGLISRIKLLAGLDIAHHQTPQSGEIRWHSTYGGHYDLRVEIAPNTRGQHTVIRVFGHVAQTKLEDLGFTDDIQSRLDRLCSLPYGLVLVTGRTGSGKSTTLGVMLRRIHERFPDKRIFTAEHPVEQDLPGIVQVPVEDRTRGSAGDRKPRTFALMLRSFLRSSPDVIMVGEIRDQETAQVAVDAALTGHLVFATLHTNTAPGAVPRLIHLGVEPYRIGDTLQAVLGQRLLRRICPRCQRQLAFEGEQLAIATRFGLGDTERRGAGCDNCYGGYAGRLAIGELMLLPATIRGKITAHTTEQELRELTKTATLLENGLVHVRAGRTTLAEILEAAWVPVEDDASVEPSSDDATPDAPAS
jgi:type II secretory ATPase GspE/PulE/Tfp pilus assembly ATPase PilB-like protein